MTFEPSQHLIAALSSDESGALATIVSAKRKQDIDELRQIALNTDGSFDAPMQRKALSAIGRIGDSADIEPLIEVLARLDDDLVRVAAIDALGRLGSAAAVDAVAGHLGDDAVVIRKTVVTALDRAGTPRARELLNELAAGNRGDALTQDRARSVLGRSR